MDENLPNNHYARRRPTRDRGSCIVVVAIRNSVGLSSPVSGRGFAGSGVPIRGATLDRTYVTVLHIFFVERSLKLVFASSFEVLVTTAQTTVTSVPAHWSNRTVWEWGSPSCLD